jgi:hypothetical protein
LNTNVDIKVTDAKYKTIFEKRVTLNDNGSFDLEFKLDNDALL